jgi:amidase
MMRAGLLQPGLNGAFVADGFGAMPSPVTAKSHALAGKRLAVKDVFDIAGLRTGAGSLAWLDQQTPATQTALAVRTMLEEGASWTGKTVTDELTYSLAGINAHYGTPENPAAEDRIPGRWPRRHRPRYGLRRLDSTACQLLRHMGHPADTWTHCGQRLPDTCP